MQQQLYILFADVDGLKAINDQYGHLEGDAALLMTATILRKTFRESDVIARIGGDEFVVIILQDEKMDADSFRYACRKTLTLVRLVNGLPTHFRSAPGLCIMTQRIPSH